MPLALRRLATTLPTLLLATLVTLAPATAPAAPMTLTQYLALTGPAPTAHIAYGSAASQYAELFLPAGPGPFPVAVLVHGGCWTVEFGGIGQMRNIAGALVASGIAVWNVEYRRVDEPGGGYPGMYQDLNGALAALQAQAPHYHLDTGRLVAIGHSAGGQLVQWLAGRARIAPGSPLYQADPLPVSHVISLGGLADLRGQRQLIQHSCDRDVEQLTGTPTAQRPDVYADTNAADLMPNGSTTVLVNGQYDTVSPPPTAQAYAALATAAGDRASTVVLPDASHYDEVAASSPSWPLILPLIQQALDLTPSHTNTNKETP